MVTGSASAWLNFLHPNPITTTGWHRHRVMMADATGSPRQKADLLEVEDRWLSLARSQKLWSGMRGEVKRAS